jgi:hypothetical protein
MSSAIYRHFGGAWSLHLQGMRVSQAVTQCEVSSKLSHLGCYWTCRWRRNIFTETSVEFQLAARYVPEDRLWEAQILLWRVLYPFLLKEMRLDSMASMRHVTELGKHCFASSSSYGQDGGNNCNINKNKEHVTLQSHAANQLELSLQRVRPLHAPRYKH